MSLLFLDSTHKPKTYHLTPECMEQDVENTSVLVNMDEAKTKGERQRTADRQRGEMGGRNRKEKKKEWKERLVGRMQDGRMTG